MITDLAQASETVIEEVVPDTFHDTEQYAHNRDGCEHGRLKSPQDQLAQQRTSTYAIANRCCATRQERWAAREPTNRDTSWL